MLRTGCILAPTCPDGGLRVSIMSRHTLSDGLTPDPRIVLVGLEWRPELAPPLKLVGDYYRRGLPWEAFEERYRQYIKTEALDAVLRLIADTKQQDITVLCIEDGPHQCHRRLLAEEVRLLGGSVAPLLL